MASPAQPNPHQPQDPEPPPLTRLTDDLLADILIRLPTLADLGRASAACPTFRRVIVDRSFRRRVHAVHRPLLLGVLPEYVGEDFLLAQPPNPSAAVARALAERADLSCSFLPSADGRSDFKDFRDGRALVSHGMTDFTVCDLLHRRYHRLPGFPDNLLVSSIGDNIEDFVGFQCFLAPSSSSEDEVGTSFRVICVMQCATKLVVFTFSSDGGLWHAATTFDGWGDLTAGSLFTLLHRRPDYAHGCFCWGMPRHNKLLMLDVHTMEFSTISVPPPEPFAPPEPMRRRAKPMAIVEAGKGEFGMFALGFHQGSDTFYLLYSVMRNDVQSAGQWQPEVTIPLPVNYSLFFISGVAGGYLLLSGILRDQQERPYKIFSLNIKTFRIELFCETPNLIKRQESLCTGFPPSLSLPTI